MVKVVELVSGGSVISGSTLSSFRCADISSFDERIYRSHFDHVFWSGCSPNHLIYEARESSLIPEGFLTAQLLQKLWI